MSPLAIGPAKSFTECSAIAFVVFDFFSGVCSGVTGECCACIGVRN